MAVFFARKFDNNLTKALQECGNASWGNLQIAERVNLDLVVELDRWKSFAIRDLMKSC